MTQLGNLQSWRAARRQPAVLAQARRADAAPLAIIPKSFVLLLAFCSFLLFHHLGARDLWASHEGRAAENASMMLSHGHWLLPRQCDFRPEMQKPPLYYWLVAGTAWLRGGAVDATAVRLPAALAALGMVCALYGFGLRRGRPLAGLLAALMLASMAHFTWLARVGRIDMPLALVVTLTLIGFYEVHEGGGWAWSLLAYVAVAAGLLLKGPIAVVLPGGVIGAFLLVEKRRPALRSLLWGVPLVLLIALPWYWWIGLRMGGGWYRSFFWYHNVERALGSGGLRSHPWWFYAPRLGMDLLPWSLLLPAAGVWAWITRKRDDDAEARFGIVWLMVIAVILSAVGFKRADYLVPAYPGAALFLGCVVERWLRGRRLVPWAAATMAGLLIVYAGGWWVYEDRILAAEERAREFRTFAAEIRARAPQPKIVVFFRVEAHALAFHLGAPVNTVLEWENIDAWLEKPESHLIVTSPECAAECVRRLPGRIERVFDNGAHELRLVVLRTIPVAAPRRIRYHARMYDHTPRPPIATTHLSLILTVSGDPADAALALQEWVGYLNGSGLEYELLLVSESGQSVDVIAAPFSRVRPLLPPERPGFGAALGAAIPRAQHPLLFYARCDLCYRPADVKQLLQAIGNVDLVVGQRVFPPEAPGGGMRERLYRLFVRTLFGVRLHDLGCVFVLARRAAFARIPIQSRGLFAHTEILAKANFLGCYFSDVSVPYRPAVAPAQAGDQRWWSDARRVIAHPDFGPPHLPEPALPTA